MKKSKNLIILTFLTSLVFTMFVSCGADIKSQSKLDLQGKGTLEEPYKIFTADDLNQMATAINSGDLIASKANYILENDINLKDQNWIPIGYSHTNFEIKQLPFKGVFDGKNFKIENLTIELKEENLNLENGIIRSSGQGLFALLDKNSLVKNLNLTNVNISQKGGTPWRTHAGGLVGFNNGGKIANCSINGKIIIDEQEKSVGGLVGTNYGEVINSISECEINSLSTNLQQGGGYAYVGGISGQNFGIISKCDFNGTVRANSNSLTEYLGGLTGRNDNGDIKDCSIQGTVQSDSLYTISGGLTGYNNGTVSKCRTNVEIISTGSDVTLGGFVGVNETPSKIFSSYAKPSIINGGSNMSEIGGFIGINNGNIEDSICDLSLTSGFGYVGIGESAGIKSRE